MSSDRPSGRTYHIFPALAYLATIVAGVALYYGESIDALTGFNLAVGQFAFGIIVVIALLVTVVALLDWRGVARAE